MNNELKEFKKEFATKKDLFLAKVFVSCSDNKSMNKINKAHLKAVEKSLNKADYESLKKFMEKMEKYK